MTPQNSSPPLGSSYPSLAPVLLGTSLKVEIEQAARLSLATTLYLFNAAARIDPPLVKEVGPIPIGPKVLRANLQAAAQHAALGHEAPTFRDCSRPTCQDAVNLIPYPVNIGPGATEAELDATSQRASDVGRIQPLSTIPPFVSANPAPFRDELHEH